MSDWIQYWITGSSTGGGGVNSVYIKCDRVALKALHLK